MNNPKFNTLLQVSDYFADDEKCREFLFKQRWPDGIVKCVFCEHDKCYTLQGKTKRFKCAKCREQFSLTKGTIYEKSPIKLRTWFVAGYILFQHNKGISSVDMAELLGVGQPTAWFMMHRLRFSVKVMDEEAPKMSGIVQADETYMGGKNKNRHFHKKVDDSQGRSGKDKTLVIGLMSQKGTVRVEKAPDASGDTLLPFIYKNTTGTAIVVSDEWKGYSNVSVMNNHVSINHSAGEHARGVFNINRLEGFWSLVKRGINGINHHVSPKHLQRYCDEYSFRYNNRDLDQQHLFVKSFAGVNRRLTYLELIDKQKHVKTA